MDDDIGTVFDIQTSMEQQLVVVSSEVLPEIIQRVLFAKRLRARGEALSAAQACRMAGISRSAFYKYKDSVFVYEESLSDKIVSLSLTLRDDKGVLSGVLSMLYELGVNVLTVNQNIPIDDVAAVTISFRYGERIFSAAQLRHILMQTDGVVEAKIISGH